MLTQWIYVLLALTHRNVGFDTNWTEYLIPRDVVLNAALNESKVFVYLYQAQHRADSRLAPSQWQKLLQSDAVSHWLGTNLESTLQHRWPSDARNQDISCKDTDIYSAVCMGMVNSLAPGRSGCNFKICLSLFYCFVTSTWYYGVLRCNSKYLSDRFSWWASCQIRKIVHALGMLGTFPLPLTWQETTG